MADSHEDLSVLVALEFVAIAAVVLVLVPLEVALPLVPLGAVLLVALYRYARS